MTNAMQETKSTTKPYKFDLRREMHDFRTNGYKLACMRDGRMFPMVDHEQFMKDPEAAVAQWQETYGVHPVERKPFHKVRRFAHRVCHAPAPGKSS